ncbi:MAG: BACON domain-containing protein [Bacteroidales bacterium]|nr:BACON domain-containing protein [Bacteroidales bacterium]
MTKDEFIQKVQDSLPIERKTDDFLEDVNNTYKGFIDDIKTIDNNVFKSIEDKTLIIQKVKESSDIIQSVIKQHLDGSHGEAYALLKNNITNPDGSLKIGVITIDKTQNNKKHYYRARIDDCTVKSYQDMFHIPNNKREIIKTERFSALGYPCLYLGNSVYDCWEELGRPSFDDLCFSGYKVVESFKVYDLRKPTKEDFDNYDLLSILERLVYVIACQFKVLHKDGHFKPEYIIPQLILELIITSNRKKKETESSPYALAWGVAYTSTHLANDFPYKEEFLENIAIPVIDTKNMYCNILMSLFEISDPIRYRYEELKENNNVPHWNSFNTDKLQDTYEYTKLGFIERRLKENNKYNQSSYIAIDSPDVITLPAKGGSGTIIIKSNDTWSLSVNDKGV